jgi:predicted ATP-grasp superfamily ATP-dependent carboligase
LFGKDIQLERLLVVGIDATSVSLSASRAGFDVFGVDFFGDWDLQRTCKFSSSLREQGIFSGTRDFSSREKMQALVRIAEETASEHEADGILLTSGLEDYPDIVTEIEESSNIIGNLSESMKRSRDWKSLFGEMRRIGISYPETEITKTLGEAKKAARDIGYPVVLKPCKGSGGMGISLARTSEEIERKYQYSYTEDKEILVQEFIQGINASASVVASETEATVLCLTEQLIGTRELGQKEPFGWCGNIVPLVAPAEVVKESIRSAKTVVQSLGLIGSNGVDFVLSDSGVPHIVEVNPRFQETIECVEKHLQTNVVLDHINACLYGKLPQNLTDQRGFWARLVLFATERLYVNKVLEDEAVRNIPHPRSTISRGEPVFSVIVSGEDKSSILMNGHTKIENMKKILSTS